MTYYRRLRTLACLAGASVGLVGMTGSAQAGLFDFLFGGFARPQPSPQYYSPPPLEMRVNPRPRKAHAREEGSPKPHVLARAIDPVKNPNWYLEDPTLRRGDVVVLKGQILVYDGGRKVGSREAFTALKDSRILSKGERDRIEQMAGGRNSTTVENEIIQPAKKPTASAEPVSKSAGEKEASLTISR